MFVLSLRAVARPAIQYARQSHVKPPQSSPVAGTCQQRCQSTQISYASNRPMIQSGAGRSSAAGGMQRRFKSKHTAREAFTILFRAHPYAMTTWVIVMVICTGSIFYVESFYRNYIVGKFTKFPEPVAKKLRRALYYTNWDFQPRNALKYYVETLKLADELGMSPFSDEIIGVKVQLAAFFEKMQEHQKAIQVLKIVKNDNLRWIEAATALPDYPANRTRLLGRTVGISVKLGDLYANQYVMQTGDAEEQLIWAVETMLKEQQRRETEGVKPGEGDWMTPEEMGGSFEALAHHYEEKDQHYLSAPLFLQALSMSLVNSCHTAILMNNLSISLAQQLPPPVPGQAPVSRPALIGNARSWAEKAIAVAAKITPPDRNEECDVGCAVATHNLGEFAEMDGNIAEARKRFEEAKTLAKVVGFADGVKNAEEALKRIAGV
ncbi:hypothetical protein BJ878DRAFT_535461 [Calycina marina]|uniref:TPR domain-containing protein n=1 Tax=Calycina marina TaxID=1763456 RepID=A0A9P7Z102_9HELO|nr:hypothetical protein BJ878DRAFT_535461 [Calycina marina]